MRWVWAGIGSVSLILGCVGIVLPLLPTVPFLILAAFCFARSSPRMHDWLVSHRTFGPLILDWQQSGAIRPTAKRAATLSIAAVFGLSLWLGVPSHVLIIQAIVLTCVLVFIWSRPNR